MGEPRLDKHHIHLTISLPDFTDYQSIDTHTHLNISLLFDNNSTLHVHSTYFLIYTQPACQIPEPLRLSQYIDTCAPSTNPGRRHTKR